MIMTRKEVEKLLKRAKIVEEFDNVCRSSKGECFIVIPPAKREDE